MGMILRRYHGLRQEKLKDLLPQEEEETGSVETSPSDEFFKEHPEAPLVRPPKPNRK